ncbi:MAG TPA: cytosine permease, partial [Naasia sp.]|jgi:purine-cytosine permease-like protein
VRLDEATYREWEESLKHLADAPEPTGAHAARTGSAGEAAAPEPRLDPAPFPPIIPAASHEPAFAPPPEPGHPEQSGVGPSEGASAGAFAPPLPAEPDLFAVAVDLHPSAEVIDAELVEEDDHPAPEPQPAPAFDAGVTGPVLVQPGPMPASSSAAFLPPAAPAAEEPEPAASQEAEEIAPLHPDAIDPLTLDEGVLNTGSLPVITSSLDRDFDDDIDDYAAVPGPLALESVAIPAAPRSSTTGGTGAVPVLPDLDDAVAPPKTVALSVADPKLPSPFLLEPAGLHPSPVDRRLRRPVAQFWLWFAPNTSALTVAVGATLIGLGLSLRQSLVAAVLGIVLACIPLGANVLAVKRSGQPAAVVSRASFGLVGNLVPTVMLLLLRVAWAAVLAWLIAGTAGRLVGLAGLGDAVAPLLVEIVVVVVISAVACVIAVFGHGLLAWVHLLLSGVSLLVVGVAVLSSGSAIDLPVALATADGSLLAMVGGIIGVFGLLAVAWTAIGGELARYQQPTSSGGQTIAFAAYGAAAPALLLIGWGALLAASSPSLAEDLRADPIAALAGILPDWYLAPLLLSLVLGLVAALATVLYSTGLTFPAANVPLDRRFTTVLAAALGGAFAMVLLAANTDVGRLLTDLVPVAAVPVAAWTGVISTELFLRTRPLSPPDLLQRGGRYPDVRWPNLAVLLAATVLGIGLLGSGPYAPFAGWIWTLLGFDGDAALPQADLGVLLALLAGLVAPAFTGRAALRRQEGRTA